MAKMLPDKHELMLQWLERGSVYIHLDPRREGVLVPQHFRSNPQLVLQIGLNFPIPIRDLEIDDRGVRCTLSFNRQPFYCIIPWSSVYALVTEEGEVTVWPSELPPEMTASPPEAPTVSAGTQAIRPRKPKDKSTSTRNAPRVTPQPVDSPTQPALATSTSADSASTAAGSEHSNGAAPKRFTRSGREVPSWLRVVK
jgi:stringent starvation protein B